MMVIDILLIGLSLPVLHALWLGASLADDDVHIVAGCVVGAIDALTLLHAVLLFASPGVFATSLFGFVLVILGVIIGGGASMYVLNYTEADSNS